MDCGFVLCDFLRVVKGNRKEAEEGLLFIIVKAEMMWVL